MLIIAKTVRLLDLCKACTFYFLCATLHIAKAILITLNRLKLTHFSRMFKKLLCCRTGVVIIVDSIEKTHENHAEWTIRPTSSRDNKAIRCRRFSISDSHI